jgi:hypothetical protein
VACGGQQAVLEEKHCKNCIRHSANEKYVNTCLC